MRKIQQFCAVISLALVLALSAFAGEIGMPGLTNAPPQEQSSKTSDTGMPGATATGDILTPGVTELDPVTAAALSLLQSLLSFF